MAACSHARASVIELEFAAAHYVTVKKVAQTTLETHKIISISCLKAFIIGIELYCIVIILYYANILLHMLFVSTVCYCISLTTINCEYEKIANRYFASRNQNKVVLHNIL